LAQPGLKERNMLAVLTVLLVLVISLAVVRVAAVGLASTGLSKDLAEFQAISAFTRSGFTTKESEEIVNHPVRRRIIMFLMLTGNAGIVIAITSLLLSFLGSDDQTHWYTGTWFRVAVLGVGAAATWALAASPLLERATWNLVSWAVKRWTRLEVHDFTGLLRVTGDYAVWELQVHAGDWLADRALSDLELPREGVLVLGIERAR
jgi:Trk-type K+ transport system membrane component